MDSSIKKTGYALLVAGIIMIVGSILQVVLVFTAVIEPVQLFSFESSDFAIDGKILFPQLPESLTRGMRVEILPADLINTVLNLGANSALVGLIIFAGGKISSIGTQLLRPVYVKVKQDE